MQPEQQILGGRSGGGGWTGEYHRSRKCVHIFLFSPAPGHGLGEGRIRAGLVQKPCVVCYEEESRHWGSRSGHPPLFPEKLPLSFPCDWERLLRGQPAQQDLCQLLAPDEEGRTAVVFLRAKTQISNGHTSQWVTFLTGWASWCRSPAH